MAEAEPRGLRLRQGQRRDVGQRGRDGQQEVRGRSGRIAGSGQFVQGDRLLLPERPHAHPPQRRDVADRPQRQGEVAGEGAHVHALAAFHEEHGVVGVRPLLQLEAVHAGRAGLQLHGLALAGEVVGALAAELDGGVDGRHLHDVADEGGEGGADGVQGRPHI